MAIAVGFVTVILLAGVDLQSLDPYADIMECCIQQCGQHYQTLSPDWGCCRSGCQHRDLKATDPATCNLLHTSWCKISGGGLSIDCLTSPYVQNPQKACSAGCKDYWDMFTCGPGYRIPQGSATKPFFLKGKQSRQSYVQKVSYWCSKCESGKWSGDYPTRSECQDCDADWKAKSCPGGYFRKSKNTSLGATNPSCCNSCKSGTYRRENSESELCQNCTRGRASSEAGVAECPLCPVGRYSDVEGASNCTACSSQVYCPEGCSMPGPLAPTKVQATPRSQSVHVTWVNPEKAGEGPSDRSWIDAVTLCANPGRICSTIKGVDIIEAILPGLKDGKTYTVTAQAHNSRNASGQTSDPSAPVVPSSQSVACIPECGIHGNCVSGVCECESDWAGSTCTSWATWKLLVTVGGAVATAISLVVGIHNCRKMYKERKAEKKQPLLGDGEEQERSSSCCCCNRKSVPIEIDENFELE